MTMTKGRIERAGTIHFHDASLKIWEDGQPAPGQASGLGPQWERRFKLEVFARIVQQLNRLGWECRQPAINPRDAEHYSATVARWATERRRDCRKGDLLGELIVSGRTIDFNMWQSVNTPNRPDNGGRYEPNREAVMPYLLRLEMERTRQRLRTYLCNVFTGYEFVPPRLSSPNPDPLAYFNSTWNGEYERKHGTNRFARGADGWPDYSRLQSSWDRKDQDGVLLNHGDIRWARDQKGRLLRGPVYGGINGQWMLVHGPGRRDFTHMDARRLFTYQAGITPAKLFDPAQRRKRLEKEKQKAVAAENFERAAVLRDILARDAA